MTTIILTPSMRAEHGFSEHGTVSQSSQPRRPFHQPRDVTMRAILTFVREGQFVYTRLEIARAVGLKKSPHVVDMIEELVNAGALQKKFTHRPNGSICYLYCLVEQGRAS